VPPCRYERTPGAASLPLSGYRRHEPERTVLYQVVQEHLNTFLAEMRAKNDGIGLPAFVEKELLAYLDCGILARGFARVRCEACATEILVALSCKGRVCPSCATRRMHDTAAHLVDRVLPHVPIRQWVLTFPWRIRLPLAYNARLLSAALTLFIRAVFTFQRGRARALGLPTTRAATSGAVTFVQRFGSALQLTPHLHTLVPDGVFVHDDTDPEARPRFVPLAPPTDAEVTALLGRVAARIEAMLVAAGCLEDDHEPPEPARVLGDVLGLPVRGARAAPSMALPEPPLSARHDGFSLHAGITVHANDRLGLERLCRYGLRPPLALERLAFTQDGRVRYRMKRTFSDGTRELVLLPTELLRRLAALVPPPKTHLVRYHGAFAPRARVGVP
jgi:hypothetical protein